ncbi:hypothetical protein ACWJJH_09760 [Endozoicomonadaceae bacterium StTr2]
MKKLSFIAAAAVAFGLGVATISNIAMAGHGHEGSCQKQMSGQFEDSQGYKHHGGKFAHRFAERRHKKLANREFNKSELETLMSARLIMLGNTNLRLGQISANSDGNYKVEIVAQDGSLVASHIVGKNSLPVDTDGDGVPEKAGLRMLAAKPSERSDISAEQARILAEAKLLMMNNPNLKVGSVKDLGEKGYSIAVVTQDGAPVTERVISKKGLPERFEKMRGQRHHGHSRQHHAG